MGVSLLLVLSAGMTTLAGLPVGAHGEITVSDADGLRRALAVAVPGTTIRIASGTYRGGISARGLRGEPGRPIVLEAADPDRPPVFEGGGSGIHLSDPAHVELHDLVVAGAAGNGINIDDGGSPDTPAHHVVLRGLVVRDVGPAGNRDGIKLSGLDDFRVDGCTVERWGDRGSGLDMVGCHRGTVAGCTFRHGDTAGGNGVQAKGGSGDITIQGCRFENAGQRAVNFGGSTGLAYFRPRPRGFEAKDITVEDCTFVGSMTPVAFVGVDGATVRHNTIYRPRRWALRILQENRQPGFAPCRDGRFTDNLIAFRSDEMTVPVDVGDGTAPDTFTLARNAWYCLDDPPRSRPRLPVAEADGVYGVDPRFRDAEHGDLRIGPDGPVGRAGARADINGTRREAPSPRTTRAPNIRRGPTPGKLVFKPEEVYGNVRDVAPDLTVHFGGLAGEAIGGGGDPTIFRPGTTPDQTTSTTTGVGAPPGFVQSPTAWRGCRSLVAAQVRLRPTWVDHPPGELVA